MTERVKPNVGIIYSDDSHLSNESKNLAHYLCAQLVTSGYAKVHLVPYSQSSNFSSDINHQRRILYLPKGSSKPVEVPVAITIHTIGNCYN